MRPKHPRAPTGFSLVEMLVVVFIIALLASVVVLTMPSDGATLRRGAERFAARTVSARDEAIASGRPVAVVLGGAGYYFERRVDGAWQPLDAGGSAILAWGDGITAALAGGSGKKAEGAGPQRQRLVFDPVGLASSDAAVRLARGADVLTVHIARDGSVRLDGP